MAQGVKWIKQAGLWVIYNSKNETGKTDELFWFSTKEQAEDKLKQLQNSTS